MPKEALPTQQFIEIEAIQNDAVILKNGGLRKILMVSGVNFDLKSEEEQQLIIYAYQGFLNSLNFSLQQFIHSRKLNIENYLNKLEQVQNKETNELLKNQIGEYREFIKSLISENAIMNKTFFVVVPYDPIQISEAAAGAAATAICPETPNFSWSSLTKSESSKTFIPSIAFITSSLTAIFCSS